MEPMTTDTRLVSALMQAEIDGETDDIIAAENAICARLDIPLDETEQGLTPEAHRRIRSFVRQHISSNPRGGERMAVAERERLMTLTEALSDPAMREVAVDDVSAAIEAAPLSEEHKQLLRSGSLASISAELRREAVYDRQQDAVEGHESNITHPDPNLPWGPCWVLVG